MTAGVEMHKVGCHNFKGMFVVDGIKIRDLSREAT
jgi:hypothetical protein